MEVVHSWAVEYYIEDMGGEYVKGSFYKDELIKTSLPTAYKVYVLNSKVVNGERKLYVIWVSNAEEFNAWIDAIHSL